MILSFDYSKILKEYFNENFNIKKNNLKIKETKRQKEAEIKEYEKKLEQLNGAVFGNVAKQLIEKNRKKLDDLKESLHKYLSSKNDEQKLLQTRVSALKEKLTKFRVSFEDILIAIFPDYSPKTYSISSTSIYGLYTLKPLTTKSLLQYYFKENNSDKGLIIELEVTNLKTKEQVKFFKTFDFDQELSDGTTIFNNLCCISEQKQETKLVFNSLYINPEKLENLYFDYIDFHYNLPCQMNIDAICKQSRKKQELVNYSTIEK